MGAMTEYELVLLAICLWREARGASEAAKAGVAHVILNRAAKTGDIVSVILAPKQFSSFNAGDPNASKFPKLNDPAFAECLAVARDPGPDPTSGADHYHSPMVHPPEWADDAKKTVQIGPFRFFKLDSLDPRPQKTPA